MSTSKTALTRYHAFEAFSRKNGLVTVNKGNVFYYNTSLVKYDVTGTVRAGYEYNNISVTNGGTIYVLINHSSISDTNSIVSIYNCQLHTDSNINEDTQTLVKVASVEWVGDVAKITQYLHSDIYCSIPGSGL